MMSDELPTIGYTDTLVFRGALQGLVSTFPVDALVVTRLKYRHPAEMAFSFQFAREERDDVMSFVGSTRAVEFLGTWEYHGNGFMVQRPHARLLLRWNSEVAGRIAGSVEAMEIAATTLSCEPDSQEVIAWFTPMDIAFRQHALMIQLPSGETMPYYGADVRPPFVVPTRFGSFALSLGDDQEEVLVEGVPARVSIPSIFMHASLSHEHRTTDLRALMDAMTVEVQILEWSLSLLNRRHVRCYRTTVYSSVSAEGVAFHEANRYVRSYSSPKSSIRLVDPRRMDPTSLGEVVQHLAASPYRVVIEQTISFLLAYWHSRFIFDRVAAAFTAFETIVNGISEIRGEARTLKEDVFKALSNRLRSSIKEFANERGLNSATRKRLYEKLGELQRPALGARAVSLLTEHEVVWRDLWLPAVGADESSLQAELARAYGLRSELVHTGRMDDIDKILADAASVHALAERLVCRIVGVRDEWLDYFAYSHAARRRL